MQENETLFFSVRLWMTELRIRHWVKNFFVFPPLFFSGRFTQITPVLETFFLFCQFCLLSSSMYLINDFFDLESDRLHPRNRSRPLASARVSRKAVLASAAALSIASLGISWTINREAFYVLSAYLVNSLAYSLYFRKQVLLDVLSISAGFMIRFMGGALVIGADISKWFLVCTFSLSLFLAFGKRRSEIEILSNCKDPSVLRKTFALYTRENLDTALSAANAMCILSYLLFVIDPETIRRHQSYRFIYTVPVVVYCLFRYMYKVQEGRGSGPVDIIFEDRILLGAILLWLCMVMLILSYPGV